MLWTPDDATGTRPLVVLGHVAGQHKKAPAVVAQAQRLVTVGGYAAVAVDAPNHGDRPRDGEFARITADNRVRMLAGEDVAARLAALRTDRPRTAGGRDRGSGTRTRRR